MLLARMYYNIGNMSIPTKITLGHIKDVVISAWKINRPPPLGRWSIKHCQNSGLIVDYANEDHCGDCNSYRKQMNHRNDSTKECESLRMQYESMIVNTPE